MSEIIIPTIFSIENNCKKCDKVIFIKDDKIKNPFFVYKENDDNYSVLVYKGIQTFDLKKNTDNFHIIEDKKVIELLSKEHNTFISYKLETDINFKKLIYMNDIDMESIFVNFKVEKNGC